jgi:hypothetical protein
MQTTEPPDPRPQYPIKADKAFQMLNLFRDQKQVRLAHVRDALGLTQSRASSHGDVRVPRLRRAGPADPHQTLTTWVSETTLAIELDDEETRVVRRTTTLPVRNVKADRPPTGAHAKSQANQAG